MLKKTISTPKRVRELMLNMFRAYQKTGVVTAAIKIRSSLLLARLRRREALTRESKRRGFET